MRYDGRFNGAEKEFYLFDPPNNEGLWFCVWHYLGRYFRVATYNACERRWSQNVEIWTINDVKDRLDLLTPWFSHAPVLVTRDISDRVTAWPFMSLFVPTVDASPKKCSCSIQNLMLGGCPRVRGENSCLE